MIVQSSLLRICYLDIHIQIQIRRYGFQFRENYHLIPIILLEMHSNDSPVLDLLCSSSVKVMYCFYFKLTLGQVKHPERSKFTVTSRYTKPTCIEYFKLLPTCIAYSKLLILLQKRQLEEQHVTAISERQTYSTRNLLADKHLYRLYSELFLDFRC